MLVAAIGIGEFYFQLKLLLLLKHGLDDLIANGRAGRRATVDQLVPGAITGVDLQQLHGYLIDLGDAQLLEQLTAMLGVIAQPLFEGVAVVKFFAVEKPRQAGKVEHAQGDAGAFENIVIAPPAFMQLALTAAHVQQGNDRQQ